MLEKLCRICPNTASWERPTGNKEESGGFAGANGFGIEEWLTRKEWLLSGYNGLLESWRYAHITALWTKNNAYVGQDMRIYLFRECPAYTLLYQFSPKDTGQSKVK